VLRNTKNNYKSYSPYLFLILPLIFYSIFVLYPLFGTIKLSLTDWDGYSATKNFIGLKNYFKIFKGDPLFIKAFWNNIYWVILGTIAPISLALPLSSMLASKVRARTFFRTVYFIPAILPAMVVGIIWGWVYNPIFGMLNVLLKKIGLASLTRAWLGEPSTALTALILAAAWSYFGFCLVIFLAALQNIDISLYEAAEIDGANSIQQFFYVTIPQLRGVLTMLLTYTMINGFAKVFDIVWVTTEGGPANSTEVLVTYIYRKAFQQNKVGYGSAMALTLSVLIVTLTVIFIKYRERGES